MEQVENHFSENEGDMQMKMHGKEGGQKDAKTENHSKTEAHMVMNPSSIIIMSNTFVFVDENWA